MEGLKISYCQSIKVKVTTSLTSHIYLSPASGMPVSPCSSWTFLHTASSSGPWRHASDSCHNTSCAGKRYNVNYCFRLWSSGLGLCVDMKMVYKILKEHAAASIYMVEDGGSMILCNHGNYLPTAWCLNPEDHSTSHYCHRNLKSHIKLQLPNHQSQWSSLHDWG
jgi:hypothetical protein